MRRFFIAAGVVCHMLFLVSIGLHFTFAPSPGRLVDMRLIEGRRPFKGILPPTSIRTPACCDHFQQLHAREKNGIALKNFISIPPRRSSNLGLDRFVRDANKTDPGGDFYQLWRAGLNLRHDLSIFEQYDADSDMKLVKRLDRITPFHPPNRYLPAMIYLAGLPLSFLDPIIAYLVWVILHELCLFLCILVTWRLTTDKATRAVLTFFWLCFLPYYLELYMGQTSFLVMTGAFLAAMAADRNKPLHAAAWWTITLIVKPLTLLFTPSFVMQRRWSTTAIGLGVLAASSLPYFMSNPADFKLFINWSLGQSVVSNVGAYCFQNGMYHLFYSETVVKAAAYAILAGALILAIIRRHWPFSTHACLWLTTYFMTYAHVWEHHYVMLLPVLVILYLKGTRRLSLILFVLLTLPSPFFIYEGTGSWFGEMLYLAAKVIPVVILFAYLGANYLFPSSENEPLARHL
ncbi:DUF2029 domain-containing protein [bacterium]|nr:DUF2029 domain-containing protein [candidate division CSSED10-310 bacterium]